MCVPIVLTVKPFLHSREKNIIFVVLLLQVIKDYLLTLSVCTVSFEFMCIFGLFLYDEK